MKYTIIAWLCLICFAQSLASQNADSAQVAFSGYVEPYYSFDFSNPADHFRQPFVYSHDRHNEVNINLAFLCGSYNSQNIRGNLAVMTGTYANSNLAAEPGVLKNILEANAGVRLSKTREIWIYAGVFSSHIGFESAIGKDNWALTRSMVADNSPYYESGVRLSYAPSSGRWYFAALFLNGWQRIARPQGNNTAAGGIQLTYKPSSTVTLNYSNFIGNDKPDDVRQTRFYNNLYGIFQLIPSLGLTLGFDYGMEEAVEGGEWNTWYTPVAIVRYAVAPKVAIIGRFEYFNDEKGVIIATGTPNGFQNTGFSLGLDYVLRPNALWRIEARGFTNQDEIYSDSEGNLSRQNAFITTALTLSF